VQGRIVDVWKENVMEELEAEEVEYETAEEFLISLKKEFGGGEEESVKVAELRKLEQRGRTMEEFVQEFKRAAVRRGSHQGGSPQDGLGDEQTCGTTLASAYVLRHLSAAWSQLQMKGRKSEWK